jgi:hypothetical protein
MIVTLTQVLGNHDQAILLALGRCVRALMAVVSNLKQWLFVLG